jgi:serine/threonine-protein kinase
LSEKFFLPCRFGDVLFDYLMEVHMNSLCKQPLLARGEPETVVQASTNGREWAPTGSGKREIVGASGPSLTKETPPVRFRHRAAALVLLAGFGVILVLHVVRVLASEPLDPALLAFHVLVVAIVSGTQFIHRLRREACETRQLGQYRLMTLLGAGGMGEVYLAEHCMLKRPCAIKLIRPERAGEPQVLARFEREVRLTAQLSHWNTVEIFDFGRTEDGTFFYVMEYLPGLSLEEMLERHGPLPAERAVYLLRQACQGLREAHAIGLIHRDIKPGNLFAAQRGGLYDVVKLLDFGLVKQVAEMPSARLTLDGAISGTPLFMSPEQARGLPAIDARSDIYSLGAVAYALLVGRPPFERTTPLEVLFAHAREEVTPPSHIRSDVPADLEQIILRCLAKNPDDRLENVDELEQALALCSAADQWTQSDAARWWQENALAADTRTGRA